MPQTNSPIIFAHEITGDGNGIPLPDSEVSQKIQDQTLAWVHLDATHKDTREWLQNEVDYLDNIVIDALLADETRPRIFEYKQGAMMILRGVNLNDNASPEDMVSIRIWVDESRIISLQRRNLKAVRDISDLLKNGNGPKNTCDFIAMLSIRLFERMGPVFSNLDDKLNDLEEQIMESPDIKERQEIIALRKQAILFRRYISPQKDVMASLRISELSWLDQSSKRRIQEAMDHIIRYIEDLDTIRERAQIVKEELANTLSDTMNKNMYMLSLVAAIFLPLGFLTGLLGVNVGGMPGVESDIAFWIVCLICVAFTLLIGGILKILKWF